VRSAQLPDSDIVVTRVSAANTACPYVAIREANLNEVVRAVGIAQYLSRRANKIKSRRTTSRVRGSRRNSGKAWSR